MLLSDSEFFSLGVIASVAHAVPLPLRQNCQASRLLFSLAFPARYVAIEDDAMSVPIGAGVLALCRAGFTRPQAVLLHDDSARGG